MDRETQLLAYRADPRDLTFRRVEAVYGPWLRRNAFELLARFRSHSPEVDVDDLVVEGLHSLSVSVRRFTFRCPECGETFLERGRLRVHSLDAHRVLGEQISLSTFAEISARLAMRRAVKRMMRPGEVLTDVFPDVVDAGQEDRLILADLIRSMGARVRGGSTALLMQLLLPRDELIESTYSQEETMSKKQVEMQVAEPNWKVLSLKALREASAAVLDFKVESKTVRAAYAEVLASLSGRKLEYSCGRCKAPVDGEMPGCWACGSSLTVDAEPEMTLAEVQARAKVLGISVTVKGSNGTRKSRTDLLAEVEAEEKSRRAKSTARSEDLSGLESARLNEQLTEMMPDGWSKSVSKQFTSYWDVNHVRRVSVKSRGLTVCFAVEDGFFEVDGADLMKGLNFYSQDERRRRHYGRDNYIYRGDVSKEALRMSEAVFKKYGKKPPKPAPKKSK